MIITGWRKEVCDAIEGVLSRTNESMSAKKIASVIGHDPRTVDYCCQLLARDGSIIENDEGKCAVYRNSDLTLRMMPRGD